MPSGSLRANPIAVDTYDLVMKALKQKKYKRRKTVLLVRVVNQKDQPTSLFCPQKLLEAGLA